MAKDWSKLYEKYKGLWVAMLDDESSIVGSGSTLNEAINQAKQGGHKDPIMMRVPKTLDTLVGIS
jgi:hypothetical protein